MAKKKKAIEKQYGKIPAGDYFASLELLKQEAKKYEETDETLREDYELGLCSDGEFYVNYGCSCQKCGLAHSFNHKEKVNIQ